VGDNSGLQTVQTGLGKRSAHPLCDEAAIGGFHSAIPAFSVAAISPSFC
jgi:hypothetical protein